MKHTRLLQVLVTILVVVFAFGIGLYSGAKFQRSADSVLLKWVKGQPHYSKDYHKSDLSGLADNVVENLEGNFFSEEMRQFLDKEALKWQPDAFLAYVQVGYLDTTSKVYGYMSLNGTCLEFNFFPTVGGFSANPTLIKANEKDTCPTGRPSLKHDFPHNWKTSPDDLVNAYHLKYPHDQIRVESVAPYDHTKFVWLVTATEPNYGRVDYSQLVEDASGKIINP